jgi:hypothetical protein
MWQGMSTAQQEPWRKMADDIRDEHRARHPDYTYKPDTGKTKRRREKKQAQGVQDDIQAVIVPTQQAQAQLDYQQSVPEQVTALAVNEKLEVGQDQVWDHDECQSIPEAVPALAPNETPEAGQDQVWDHDEYQPEDVPFDFSEYVDLDQFDFDI